MTSNNVQTNTAEPQNIFEAAWLGTKTSLTALRVKGREWGQQAATSVRNTAKQENLREQCA